jgi:hypothetical protein
MQPKYPSSSCPSGLAAVESNSQLRSFHSVQNAVHRIVYSLGETSSMVGKSQIPCEILCYSLDLNPGFTHSARSPGAAGWPGCRPHFTKRSLDRLYSYLQVRVQAPQGALIGRLVTAGGPCILSVRPWQKKKPAGPSWVLSSRPFALPTNSSQSCETTYLRSLSHCS